MITSVKVSAVFECSLERAFKTPMLCDIARIHTGFGPIPRVTHTTDDDGWGKPGSSKKVYVAKSIYQKDGFAFVDKIIERRENRYWQIQIDDFQFRRLGFYKFLGKWETKKLGENRIHIEYTYELYSNSLLLYPICWIFGKTVWHWYMRRVLENIRALAYEEFPYQFE